MTKRKPDRWPSLNVQFSREEIQRMIFLYESGLWGAIGVPGVVERIVARWLTSPEGEASYDAALKATDSTP